MSMIVTTLCPEGIVMAADSAALTFKFIDMENLIKGNVHAAMANMANGTCAYKKENIASSKIMSRTIKKLHVMKGSRIAIAEGNQKVVNNISLTPYIEYFCNTNEYDNPKSCAEGLLNFIKELNLNVKAEYHVCGYNTAGKFPMPEFWYVDAVNNKVFNGMGNEKYGMNLGSANEYFFPYSQKINNVIHLYSLQEAIDVSLFAIDMSIKLERFIDRDELISPPIDLLVIKPDGVKWIQQKTLKGEF